MSSAWVALGIAAWTFAGSTLHSRQSAHSAWDVVEAVPTGVLLYALVLLPAFGAVPPAFAPRAAALLGIISAAAVLAVGWRARSRHNAVGSRRADPPRGPVLAPLLTVSAAGVVAFGAYRLAHAVLLASPFPPVLGEPSSGDMGLHALRVGMIARAGVPPPSPLDPDYPLQYRYLFHALAASLATTGGVDTARATASACGIVTGSLVLAGGSLAWRLSRSGGTALAAGLLAALYGPSYWVGDAVALLSRGQWPGLLQFAHLMGGPWSLSPFAPSFPSVLTAMGSSPSHAMSALTWLAVLHAAALVDTSLGRSRWAAFWLGLTLALLAFDADFFAPLALLALAAGAAYAWWLSARRGAQSWRPVATWSATGLLLGLASTFGVTRQIAATGAAQGPHLEWNAAMAFTAVYGGNHALLAGGELRPLPNLVALHDWGVLFGLGAVVGIAGAVWRRSPVLLAGALGAAGTALFWQLFTVAYQAGTATDFRVQMYHYASMATAAMGPVLPIGLRATLWPRNGAAHAARSPWRIAGACVRWAALSAATLLGGGAGMYLLAGASTLRAVPPATLAGDAGLALVLAQQPAAGGQVNRLAVLAGPDTFLGMYEAKGGYVPLWWARGAAAVPVGWDFGHPERYQPLYRRVAVDFDPAAAAALQLTHVAVAPGQLTIEAGGRLEAFLTHCRATLVATLGQPMAPEGRQLWRIDAAACGASAAG